MLDEVAKHISLTGTVVDLGAGPGIVTEHLLNRGLKTVAVDTSTASIGVILQRLGSHPALLGAFVSDIGIPLGNETADGLLMIETLEHLDAPAGQALLQEVARVLRPGGHVVLTTPYREDLSAGEIMCPSCGCAFHRMQHLRSFGMSELTRAVEEAGFRTVVCRPVYFSPLRGMHRLLERLRRRIERLEGPSLLYLGARL